MKRGGKAEVTLGQNDIYAVLFILHPVFINRLILNGMPITSLSSAAAVCQNLKSVFSSLVCALMKVDSGSNCPRIQREVFICSYG